VIRIDANDIERMTQNLFIERGLRSRGATKFWVLLVLAAVIATAGLVADSSATVIGAMIVAPLMTPILGSALAVVLADRRQLIRSVTLIIGGALVVIAIGYVIAVFSAPPDAFATNSQVQSRVSPRLIDLLAAIATGTVGAFALVRSDISDALPGVAIAISLVPPLAVVGLLLEVHRYSDAGQAGLLFGTNVAAIIATGTGVFLTYRVREVARLAGVTVGRLTGLTLTAVIGLVVVVAIPLTIAAEALRNAEDLQSTARPVAQAWARAAGWRVATVEARNNIVFVTALGPPPEAEPVLLRKAFDANGLAGAGLRVHLITGGTIECPSGSAACALAK